VYRQENNVRRRACCLRAVNVIKSVFYGLARHLSPGMLLDVVKTTFLCGFDSFRAHHFIINDLPVLAVLVNGPGISRSDIGSF
jgi:hypothetical protein